MLLSFPADLCTDRGRAVNATLPDWSQTLRGEAAEIYLRWERDLKPGGFHPAHPYYPGRGSRRAA